MTSLLNRLPRVLTLAGIALLNAVPAVRSDIVEVPRVDHHLHLFSPETSRVLTAIYKAKGPNACPAEVSHEPSSADEVIRALDAAGIQQGVLLSTAYFCGSPAIANQQADIPAAMRTENSFIVAQARSSCERLIPFISVNPLLPNAIEEIDYWGKQGGAAGLKLQLGNSDFDFRDPQQVVRLAAVFAGADCNWLSIGRSAPRSTRSRASRYAVSCEHLASLAHFDVVSFPSK